MKEIPLTRSVTRQQNNMNSHATWAGSGVRGVYANRNGRRYTARLVLDGKQFVLGSMIQYWKLRKQDVQGS